MTWANNRVSFYQIKGFLLFNAYKAQIIGLRDTLYSHIKAKHASISAGKMCFILNTVLFALAEEFNLKEEAGFRVAEWWGKSNNKP